MRVKYTKHKCSGNFFQSQKREYFLSVILSSFESTTFNSCSEESVFL